MFLFSALCCASIKFIVLSKLKYFFSRVEATINSTQAYSVKQSFMSTGREMTVFLLTFLCFTTAVPNTHGVFKYFLYFILLCYSLVAYTKRYFFLVYFYDHKLFCCVVAFIFWINVNVTFATVAHAEDVPVFKFPGSAGVATKYNPTATPNHPTLVHVFSINQFTEVELSELRKLSGLQDNMLVSNNKPNLGGFIKSLKEFNGPAVRGYSDGWLIHPNATWIAKRTAAGGYTASALFTVGTKALAKMADPTSIMAPLYTIVRYKATAHEIIAYTSCTYVPPIHAQTSEIAETLHAMTRHYNFPQCPDCGTHLPIQYQRVELLDGTYRYNRFIQHDVCERLVFIPLKKYVKPTYV